MAADVEKGLAAIRDFVGREIGVSQWHLVDQARIDAFAAVTDDAQFIHCDPAAAAVTDFGGTIAHGFLLLSLLSRMSYEALPAFEGRQMSVNYGFDKVRFLAPVRSGSRVRARFTLAEIARRGPAAIAARYGVSVEAECEAKPALIAEWTILSVLGGAAEGEQA